MHFIQFFVSYSVSNHRGIIVFPLTTDTLFCLSDAPVCLSKNDLKHSSQSLKGLILTNLKLLCFVRVITNSNKTELVVKTKTKKEKDCNRISPEIPFSQDRYNGSPPLNGGLWPTVSVTQSHTLWCQMVK